jgi:hypothetical protein
MVPVLDPPHFTLPPALLRPGGILTIYGTSLGPQFCGVPIPQNGPYPLEACGVRVTAGGIRAGLMYVSENQINLKLPEGLPDALTPIQVYFGDLRSDPAMAQFSTHTAFLHLQAPAYVHMPIWIEVDLPYPHRAPYPCGPDPWDFFDTYQLEVRRNGVLLPQAARPPSVGSTGHLQGCMSGFGFETLPYRLPLHLAYRLEDPGVYSVRLTMPRDPAAQQVVQSAWTDIAVQPCPPGMRTAWLRSMAAKIRSASMQELVRDIIPSLLALPDDKAFAVLLPVYSNWLRRARCVNLECFAAAYFRRSLDAFGTGSIRRVTAHASARSPNPATPAPVATSTAPLPPSPPAPTRR